MSDGVLDWFWGIIEGDFNEDPSAGQIIIGIIIGSIINRIIGCNDSGINKAMTVEAAMAAMAPVAAMAVKATMAKIEK